MGKSLIIKGADFSANGFKYSEVITDVSTLYIKNDEVLTADNWPTLSSSANSKFAAESTSGTLLLGTGIAYNAYAKADCSNADKVVVKTRAAAPPQYTFYGFAIILFTDEQGNIVGGYTNAPIGSTSPSGKTTPLGIDATIKEYEANVPTGAKYVYSTFSGNLYGSSGPVNPLDPTTKFEMKLVKYTQE